MSLYYEIVYLSKFLSFSNVTFLFQNCKFKYVYTLNIEKLFLGSQNQNYFSKANLPSDICLIHLTQWTEKPKSIKWNPKY